MSKEKRLAATPFPCGQCLPCRINQRRVWTHRIMLEQHMHGDNLWVTLTYNDDNNPVHVKKEHIQKWLKRVRKESKNFRYFIVGEYGEKTWRPHYHCCLFGLSKNYCQLLFDKWGFCEPSGFFVSELNEKTAQYTAGYTTAKLAKREDFKKNGLQPEFMLSSRRDGGIGYPAIIQIAKRWKCSRWRDSRIIRELRDGKIEKPLGRYLTSKLSELLKIPQHQLDAEYWCHQEEIFEKHLKSDPLEYIENLVNEDKTKFHRMDKRYRMWKNRNL